jgi:hypothetical protein
MSLRMRQTAPGGPPTSPGVAPADPRKGISSQRAVSRVAWAAIAMIVLSVAVSLSYQWWHSTRPPTEIATSTPLSAEAFEARYGIHLNMLGVIATGGLLDLRFTVTDPVKAAQVFGVHLKTSTGETHGSAAMPVLVPEGTRTVIPVAGAMSHHVYLHENQSLNLLYPNPGGVIQGGTVVSVVIGGVRVDGVTAQI